MIIYLARGFMESEVDEMIKRAEIELRQSALIGKRRNMTLLERE